MTTEALPHRVRTSERQSLRKLGGIRKQFSANEHTAHL